VLFAGHLRPDKGLDVAVAAAAHWHHDAVLAVVGQDDGALAGALRQASARGVHLVVAEGYQPTAQFVAAVAAADVLILPYRVASASGVQALAAALGRPTVAADVGGLSEFATVSVPGGDPGALAAAVDKALASPAPAPSWPGPAEVARSYLAAY
jgi:glycosyltransferase involved in cell wall biosynthesis